MFERVMSERVLSERVLFGFQRSNQSQNRSSLIKLDRFEGFQQEVQRVWSSLCQHLCLLRFGVQQM